MQGDIVPSTHPKEKRVFSPSGRQEREQSHHQPELDPRSFIIIEASQKSVGSQSKIEHFLSASQSIS